MERRMYKVWWPYNYYVLLAEADFSIIMEHYLKGLLRPLEVYVRDRMWRNATLLVDEIKGKMTTTNILKEFYESSNEFFVFETENRARIKHTDRRVDMIRL